VSKVIILRDEQEWWVRQGANMGPNASGAHSPK